jgi:hypothetical protein
MFLSLASIPFDPGLLTEMPRVFELVQNHTVRPSVNCDHIIMYLYICGTVVSLVEERSACGLLMIVKVEAIVRGQEHKQGWW